MTTDAPRPGSGRLRLTLIAAVFAAPLMFAAWMYYSDSALTPGSGTNKGALLLPIARLADELPHSRLHAAAPNLWLMLYTNTALCARDCAEALIRLRQTRLMLGNEANRVRRVFLHGDSTPDTVDLDKQHAGLITMNDNDLSLLLERKRPAELQAGGCYLIDPLGNLVMYFPPGLDPKELVGDIKHLLKLSHIG